MAEVLLIDDEEAVRELCTAMLLKMGHRVTPASNGREARSLFEERPFDIVITDIFMPDGDGFDVIAEYRRIYKSAKIIAISGGGRVIANDLLRAAKHLGAIQILAKPFSKDELATAIAATTLQGTPGKSPVQE